MRHRPWAAPAQEQEGHITVISLHTLAALKWARRLVVWLHQRHCLINFVLHRCGREAPPQQFVHDIELDSAFNGDTLRLVLDD